MTVTPSGDPPWARTASHDVYGGHSEKTNYQSQGAINPKTDITAEQWSRLVEDLAACVNVAEFANLNITCNDTSPAAPTQLGSPNDRRELNRLRGRQSAYGVPVWRTSG